MTEHITEDISRQIIPIAAQCGFELFQIDDGWISQAPYLESILRKWILLKSGFRQIKKK